MVGHWLRPHRPLVVALAMLLFFGQAGFTAERPTPQPRVTGVLGSATYAIAGDAFQPIRSALPLPAETIIRTGPRSAVDLSFGGEIGWVRLLENSTLILERMTNSATGGDSGLILQLLLTNGTLLGKTAKLPPTARFEIKTSSGSIAGIHRGQWRVSADSIVVLVDGSLTFVHSPKTGDPVPFAMKAPPVYYFSPFERTRPAPRELEREVIAQLKSKLPGL
jgi:hypothetical protein